MRRLRPVLLALLGAGFVTAGDHAALAAPGGVFGVGRDSCGGFTTTFWPEDQDMVGASKEAMEMRLMTSSGQAEVQYLDWAQGFMSALNIQRDLHGQPEVNLDTPSFRPPAQLYFLERYCQAHQDILFWEAVQVLFDKLGQLPPSPTDR